MKSNNFKENIAPSLVLVCICFVITFALVATHGVTKPIIEKNQQKAADIARTEVLAEGDSFEEFDCDLVDGVLNYNIAKNKSGVAIESTAKSFGGILTCMVGIDKDGKITGVKVTKHADTPGLGTKAMTPEYLEATYNEKGLDAASAGNIKDSGLDYIVGASISSNGVYHAVKGALEQFEKCGGVN